jgi:UDP-GlcNAc:undecaprenyl-phosphate GlcNAc-1-phosphate transferase
MNASIWMAVFAVSLAVAGAAVATAPLHQRWTGDPAGSGIQKHHHGSPPRIGVLPLAAACLAGWWLLPAPAADAPDVLGLLLLCALPTAAVGLLEDITGAVRARWRLLAPAGSTLLGMMLLGTVIPTLGVPPLDGLMTHLPLAATFTMLMVVGYTQALNIVDGLNGLAGGLALLMLLATAAAAYHAGDAAVLQAALVLAAAVAGFLVINYPRGLMFLGDGGAYVLGFALAQLWILLLVRNPGEVSPWFVMAVAAHPTIETIFSIVRRRLLARRRIAATAPDRQHLHSLMYRHFRRAVAPGAAKSGRAWVPNAAASALLVGAAAVPIALACLNPGSALWGLSLLVLSTAGYGVQFHRLVHFKGPWPLRPSVARPFEMTADAVRERGA